jgi:2-polyprenyl-3-methyl-5-hydroxy-6-metoxy-1,4-benzoquinol methylase
MVSRDEVIYAYRLLLGRDPENEEVIERHLNAPDCARLRDRFLGSAEFRAKFTGGALARGLIDFSNSAPLNVDVEISDEHFHRLIRHIQTAWEALGTEKPHWSVLTNPKFLPDNIETSLSEFYGTGERSIQLLHKAAARAGRGLPATGTCFELGCGVGRVTAPLAGRFKHVIACDISHPHLQLASKHLRSEGATNVSFLQLKSLETLENLEPFDVFYSVIVLQHNPPPLIYRLLRLILGKVRMGGYAYFQVPVSRPDYRFSIADYLKAVETGKGAMEMHILPQVYLFRVLDEHGFRILDLQRDGCTGPAYQSVTTFAEKVR